MHNEVPMTSGTPLRNLRTRKKTAVILAIVMAQVLAAAQQLLPHRQERVWTGIPGSKLRRSGLSMTPAPQYSSG